MIESLDSSYTVARSIRLHISQLFRIAAAIVSLAGALLLGSCSPILHVKRVLADTANNDYNMQTQIAVNTSLTNALLASQAGQNSRLDALETRLNEQSADISRMQGAGGAILVVLGVLNILGLLQARQVKKDA